MKRLFLLVLFSLLAVSAMAGTFAPIIPAGAQKTTHADYALLTLDGAANGFLTVATATLTVGTSTAVLIGTMPTGTKVIDIYVFDNDLNIGPSGVGTGAKVAFIASGSMISIKVATTTPAIYFRGRSGTGTAYLQAR